jgi:hypothetical protein
MGRHCPKIGFEGRASHVLFAIVAILIHAKTSARTYINGTGGSFALSLYQQAVFFYEFVSPEDSILYDGPGNTVGRCNVMGYWTTKNSQQLLNGDFTKLPGSLTTQSISAGSGTISLQTVEDSNCKDVCTTLNGCGFDSCLTPKPDRASREPIGEFTDAEPVTDEIENSVC